MDSTLVIAELITFIVLVTVFLLFFGRIRSGIMKLRETTNGREGDTAFEILDRRYADGEISREDYLRIKSDITGNRDA